MDNSPRSSSGYAGEKDTGDLVKEQVTQGAQQAMDKTQQVAGQVTESAKSQARSAFESQKQTAVENISHVAQALRSTSDTLEAQNVGMVGGVFDAAADRLEGTSTYLQNQTLDGLMQDAEQFARQNTWVFMGGAFALGLAAARFLKSSAPRPSYNDSYGSYGSSGNYGSAGYGGGYGSYGSSYAGGYGASSSSYGSYAPSGDISTAGTPGFSSSYGGPLTETDTETTDVVFEPGTDTGAIDGTTTGSR